MIATASPAVFEASLNCFRAEFERLGAVIDLGDEGRFVDPTKTPEALMSAYDLLRQYGYANGLLGTSVAEAGP